MIIIRSFYNSVLSSKGDIFEDCRITQKLFRKVLLVDLLDIATKLEREFFSQNDRSGERSRKEGC